MLPLNVAVDHHRHVHRFPVQLPEQVTGVQFCHKGHAHEQRRRLYRCFCGFALTMPLEEAV